MSIQYDNYLLEHKRNVAKGLHWMADNLNFQELNIDYPSVSNALNEALLHDTSKTDPVEYRAYDAYFYGKNRSYQVVRDFNYAWLHHIHSNPHHWQYWILFEDDPNEDTSYKVLEIPTSYILEMIADWWSFSWKKDNLEEIFDWYDVHRDKIVLHPKSRKLVENILDALHKTIIFNDWDAIEHSEELEDKKYGLPEQKKYPMPDADHVRSAIRFFNYVEPEKEEELANAILKYMKEHNMSFGNFKVGDENRFKNYIPEKTEEET